MSDESGVSDTIISTPQGGGAISGIGESFSPDLHTGTGNVTVPISVPTGRNGLQPELELGYSTGNGTGPFGMGWSLSVPGVTRKTSDGVPRYRDDDPDDRDTFLLSGAENLVPVAVWEYSSADSDKVVKNKRPTDEEIAAAPIVQYSPRTAGSFARIRHHRGGDDDYWEVERKTGQVSYYGTPRPDDADPDWQDPAVVANPEGGDVFAWKLTETRDEFGNRIMYDYERDLHPTESPAWDQVYLTRIRYVDHGDPDNPGFLVSVEFEYEDRPDPFSDYRAGFEIRTCKRCSHVAIRTHADEDRLSKTYELTYLDERDDLAERLPPNGVSLLSRIKVVGHDGTKTQALPPLEFGHTRFRPKERDFFATEGDAPPTRSLGNPDLELVDLFGDGMPDVVETNGSVRYWRNLGGGEFDRPQFMERAPAGLSLSDRGVQLLDADGDGRADMLVNHNDMAGYFPMDLDGQWAEEGFRRYDRAPSFDFQNPEVQLVDLTGDGVTDAVRSGSRFECYFNDPDEGWTETRRVHRGSPEAFPDVDFSDSRVHLADMVGDGLQDIVLVHDGNVAYWPNLGHGDWSERIHMADSPRFEYGYNPDRILVGDVDGDGAADLVYVDDKVTLWINRSGNGWSDPIEIAGTPPVDDVDDVRLVDLLGTGVAGVLWSTDVHGPESAREHSYFLDFTGGTKPYLLDEMDNHMGAVTRVEYVSSTEHALSDRQDDDSPTPLPFPVQVVDSVETVDAISGSKRTTEYAYHHGYWDGAEREFRGFGMVEQSDTGMLVDRGTADYDAAIAPGDDAGVDAGANVEFEPNEDGEQVSPPALTRTWFHQGPVGPERGGWHEPDYSDEYWAGDDQHLGEAESLRSYLADADVPRRAKRDALRALRGRVLRTEVYGLDGSDRADRPYRVTESLHDVREEYAPADGDGTRVFFPHAVAERRTNWERGTDPLTKITFTDDYDEHGQSRRETKVALPRRSETREGMDVAERGRLSGDELNETRIQATRISTEYADPGDGSYLHDRVAQVRTVALRNPPTVIESDPGDLARVLRDQVRAAREVRRAFDDALDGWQRTQSLPSSLDLVDHMVNHYDGDAFEGLPPGELGQHGALSRREVLVLPEDRLDDRYESRRPAYLGGGGSLPDGSPGGFGSDLGYSHRRNAAADYHAGYYADVERRRYDVQDGGGRGFVTGTEDPLGNRTGIEPDRYRLLPARATDPAGLERTAEYDYRVLDPETVTGPNGTTTQFRYTPLGQVGERFLRGPDGAGGNKAEPEVCHEYDLRAYERTRDREDPQPASVHTTRRVTHASESTTSETVESRAYSDGFGRLVQQRTDAPELVFGASGSDVGLPRDPDVTTGPATGQRDPDRVVVSGWTVYDDEGRVVEKYEPFFASGWDYDPESDAKRGEHVTQRYDPLGRVVRTENPDGSEQRVVFGVPSSPSTPADFEPTPWERHTYDANDGAGRTHPSDATLDPVDHHRNTPTSEIVDALGRTLATVERTRDPGQGIERHLTQYRYDVRGNEIEVVDPEGRSAFEYGYDLRDDRLRRKSIDAGVETVVRDATGAPVETRDGKGSVALREYDELNRPTHLWARDDGAGGVTLREQLVYGDGVDAGTARSRNLLGRLYEHYDEAGLLRVEGYDFKGNVTRKTRRVVSDGALSGGWTADWSAPDAEADLESAGYVIETAYDALDRPTETTYPADVDGNRATLAPTYDSAGQLSAVALDGTTFVDRLAYNARGQRTLASYGNGTTKRYAYDPETFRLARLRTETTRRTGDTWSGTGTVYQDVAYAYDLVGNVLSIDDRTPDSGIPGSSDGSDRLVREFEYDPRYRLTRAMGREHDVAYPKSEPWNDHQGDGDPSRTRRYERFYRYDAADNLAQLRHVAGGEDFERQFELEAGSNRLDRLTVDDGTTEQYGYDYDGSGNLLNEDGTRRFGWDHADRLRSFRDASSGQSPETYYLYDAGGRRVKKLVERDGAAESTTYVDGVFEHHRWIRDGSTEHENNRLQVMDDRTRIAVVRRGDPHPDDGRPAVQYHLGDHLGSSTVVVDGSGARVDREEYFPYGETSFGSVAEKRYRFGGKERDAESGAYYFGARYYAPWLGRWTSTDPAGVVDGLNLYRYARSNPVNRIDPTGRESGGASVLRLHSVSTEEIMFDSGLSLGDVPNLNAIAGPSQAPSRIAASEKTTRTLHAIREAIPKEEVAGSVSKPLENVTYVHRLRQDVKRKVRPRKYRSPPSTKIAELAGMEKSGFPDSWLYFHTHPGGGQDYPSAGDIVFAAGGPSGDATSASLTVGDDQTTMLVPTARTKTVIERMRNHVKKRTLGVVTSGSAREKRAKKLELAAENAASQFSKRLGKSAKKDLSRSEVSLYGRLTLAHKMGFAVYVSEEGSGDFQKLDLSTKSRRVEAAERLNDEDNLKTKSKK